MTTFDQIVQTNLLAPAHHIDAALPHLRRTGGIVVIISSYSAWTYSPVAGVAYSASKTGLTALTRTLNSQEAGFGVRACHFCPGDVNTDFLQFRPEEKFDLVLCCQVLEHVSEPTLFCERLRDIAKQLIISVPYKWLGNAPGHVNDPVDEVKLEGWMQVKPNNSQVVYEPFREGRLIAYYNLVEGPRFRFKKDFVISALAERTVGR
jgi:NAD(P)-dependent dehydrogenase (short-subunit alcohol dehydrogenase family)